MTIADAPWRSRSRALWFGLLILALFGSALTVASWRTWGDVMVDLGRELYVPWRLAAGDVLYRDVASFNGPLSPHWNALLFRIFGTGYLTLVVANLAILAIATFLWVRLLASWAGTFAATVAGAVFLAVFGLGHLIYIGCFSWVAPYSHEMTHGLVLSLAALAALGCAQRGTRPGLFGAVAGLSTGLVFLTKAEVFLGLALGLAAGTLVLLRYRLPRERRRAYCVAFVLGGLLPIALSFALLARQLPASEAWRGTIGSFAHVANREISSLLFYRTILGTDQPLANLGRIGRWLLIDALVFLPALGLGFLYGRAHAKTRWIVAAGVFVTTALLLHWLRPHLHVLEVARPFPILLVFAIVSWVRRAKSSGDWDVIPAALLLFALGLLAKVVLNVRIQHYGFGLAFPAAGVLIAILLGRIPAWMDRKGASGLVFQAAALGFLVAVTGALMQRSFAMNDRLTTTVGAGVDRMRADLRGKLVNVTLRDLEESVGPDETVLVLPEGVMLNYLARRRSPTPFINFMPPELILFGEGRMLAELRRNPPAVIVIAHKDTSEYGFRFFGTDYGQALMSWVKQNYERRSMYGQPPLVDNMYGMEVLVPRKAQER